MGNGQSGLTVPELDSIPDRSKRKKGDDEQERLNAMNLRAGMEEEAKRPRRPAKSSAVAVDDVRHMPKDLDLRRMTYAPTTGLELAEEPSAASNRLSARSLGTAGSGKSVRFPVFGFPLT